MAVVKDEFGRKYRFLTLEQAKDEKERVDMPVAMGDMKDEPWSYVAKVERVIDGDTVELDIDVGFGIWIKRKMRLYGINTPETRTRDKEEKERGLAAKARLKELIDDRDRVRIMTYGNGKFGRLLGDIWVKHEDGKWSFVNDLLVKEGHAEEYDGGKR